MSSTTQSSAAGVGASLQKTSDAKFGEIQEWYDKNYPNMFRVVRRNRRDKSVKNVEGQPSHTVLSKTGTQPTDAQPTCYAESSGDFSQGVQAPTISVPDSAMSDGLLDVDVSSPPPGSGEIKYQFYSPGLTCTWAVRVHIEWPFCYVWLYFSPCEDSWVWIQAWMRYGIQTDDRIQNEWGDNFDLVLERFRQGIFSGSPVSLDDDHLCLFRNAIRGVVLGTWEVSVAQANHERKLEVDEPSIPGPQDVNPPGGQHGDY
jgi:hypothetical protein